MLKQESSNYKIKNLRVHFKVSRLNKYKVNFEKLDL